ncbi:MAG: translation initiation factor IF-2 N-terminal domain-containing protein, partial [Actinomycetota bacterium]|nr:translation initiation factor IF-2 N-terminal domain-containing protein [Actinomycetota bacterium]
MHELAKELGMTNAELIELSDAMGVGVKSHSSSIIEAQADRIRRRAERDGLTRAEQPEEPKKPAKAPTKKAAAKKSTAEKTGAPAAPSKDASETAAAEPLTTDAQEPAAEQLTPEVPTPVAQS